MRPERSALYQFGRAVGPCVYFARVVREDGDSTLKIGVTRSLAPRFELLAYFERADIELLGVIPGARRPVEQELIRRFRPYRARGLEFFRDVPEIRDAIAALPVEHRPSGLGYADRGTRHGHPGTRQMPGCARCEHDAHQYLAAQASRAARLARTRARLATLAARNPSPSVGSAA